MKRLPHVVLVGLAVLLLGSGCVTNGVIGPVSHWNSERIRKDVVKERISRLTQISEEDRVQAIQFTDMGLPNTVGIGVDLYKVNALMQQPISMIVCDVIDAAIYAGVYAGLDAAFNGSDNVAVTDVADNPAPVPGDTTTGDAPVYNLNISGNQDLQVHIGDTSTHTDSGDGNVRGTTADGSD